MKTHATHSSLFLRDLGDGLIMRRSSTVDAEALANFNARIHSDDGPDKPDERVASWVRDLLSRPHPTFDPRMFTIVEDTSSGRIVSSLNLIPQTWSYGGIPFGVGRPELVGTLPEFRNRGLVRAQFEIVHRWSAERGDMLQAITGIPYYYRQFGYEMGMSLGGGRIGFAPQVPKLKEGEAEAYRVRPATQDDLGFISGLYQHASQRYLVSCLWDEALWRYELSGKSEKNVNRLELHVIEVLGENGHIPGPDRRVGYLAHPPWNWRVALAAIAYELRPGISWGAVTPSVVRYLYAAGKAYAEKENKLEEFSGFGFWLGSEHPVYQVLKDGLRSVRKPYAWYIRLPDLPAFLGVITPVLEKRLVESPYAGHSGELKLTFYRSGLHLTFDKGALRGLKAWNPEPQGHSGDAAFPELTFLQLLFGYRSLDELDYAFADCWWDNDTAYGLLNALFPKQVSNLWPVV